MTTQLKFLTGVLALLVFISCKKTEDYSMGDLAAPSDVVLSTEIVGKDATHPNGDGSGDVKITITGKNILSYKVDYDASDPVDLVFLKNGTVTKKYTKLGLNNYIITAVAYGKGGTATTVTSEIALRSDFRPDPATVSNLTGTGSKTWVVDKSIAAHFGVGPWEGDNSDNPFWWKAGVNEKVACCNCFYTTTFKFTKVDNNGNYTLQVTSPDGAFTKTGALAGGLPGIPGSGDEKCYPYAGATSAFSLVPASSEVMDASESTKTAIQLAGVSTFIGYGALLKEYEILSISETAMALRVQGTETGNSWWLKLKAL